MAADANPVKLQEESTGILVDKYQGTFIDCVTREGVVSKAETYVYRCSVEKVCCATGCCLPGAAGFPLWLLILILVLAFLLALLLLGFLIRYCCANQIKKKTKNAAFDKRASKDALPVIVTGTPPRVEIFDNKRSPNGLSTVADVQSHQSQPHLHAVEANGRRRQKLPAANQRQKAGLLLHDDYYDRTAPSSDVRKSVEHVTILTDLESDAEAGGTVNRQATAYDQSLGTKLFSGSTSGQSLRGEQRGRFDQEHRSDQGRLHESWRSGDQFGRSAADPSSSFEPSPMEVSYERPPKPIPVSFHDRSEISVEKRPLLNRLDRPEEQQARMVYYKAESSRNQTYNERTEYDDD